MKQVSQFKKGGLNKNSVIFSHWRDLTGSDVRSYFVKIRNRLGKTYCQRCGITISKEYMNKEVNLWEGFGLCDSCYKHKMEGRKENTPDLEDIERFNLVNNFLV